MGRLVTMAKIKIGQLMSKKQLLDLLKFCMYSKIPWAPHALACLLQDVMENENENENTASTSWATNDFLSDVANLCEFTDDDNVMQDPTASLPMKTASTSNNQLPSVYESDDSDLEEIIDCFDKQTVPPAKKTTKNSNQTTTRNSVALDSRMDLSVDASAEISLRRIFNKNTQTLLQSINANVVMEEADVPLAPWPSVILPFPPEQPLHGNTSMITQCFDSLFEDLQIQEASNIEHILQLWLTLNSPYKDHKFNPAAVPSILLKEEAVKNLISAIAWAPGLSLITWCVSLQTLTLVCNTSGFEGNSFWSHSYGMASTIVNHPDFIQIFMRLLSGSGITFVDKFLVSITQPPNG